MAKFEEGGVRVNMARWRGERVNDKTLNLNMEHLNGFMRMMRLTSSEEVSMYSEWNSSDL